MIIPKRFKIGGVTWTVKEVEVIPGGCFGQTELWNAEISITKSLKQDTKEQTYIHELLHALMFSMGKRNHDEEFVDGLATLLHQYLKQQK